MGMNIDELSLKITVDGKDALSQINAISQAISNLQAQLGKLGLDRIPKLDLGGKSGLGGNGKKGEIISKEQLDDLNNIHKPFDLWETKLAKVNEELSQGNLTAEKALQLTTQRVRLETEIAKSKDLDNTKDNSLLLRSIKRVALYRIIRGLLKVIGSSISDSIKAVAQISPQFNNTMSQLTSSLQILRGSLGSLVVSVLPIIQPLLTGIATVLANISNVLAKTIATLRGQSTYIKINTDYWKDYQNTINGTLLSFDTFTTLSSNNTMEGLFEETDTNSFSTQLSSIKTILDEILGIIVSIGASALIVWIINGGLAKIPVLITAIGKGIKTLVTEFTPLYGLVGGIILAVENIITTIQNLDTSSVASKILTITSALMGLASAIFAVLSALPGVGHTMLMKGLSLATLAIGTITTLVSGIAKFADGGMMTGSNAQLQGAGTMYAIAGESGAEIVAQGSSGTGVTNIEQFKVAMVQALYEYGASKGNLSDLSVEMDGAKVGKAVASSTGFRNEATRRGNSWR